MGLGSLAQGTEPDCGDCIMRWGRGRLEIRRKGKRGEDNNERLNKRRVVN